MNNRRQPQMDLLHALEQEKAVACEQLPDVFFPEDFADPKMRNQAIRVAKNLCSECPVKWLCLEAALANKEGYGIWGGLTAKERGTAGR
jgi:WhiB family redox-sensing transcriptional regulator